MRGRGGMKDGYQLKCWLPGGASTDFLMPEHLDLAMDFDTIAKAGSRMGTGLLTVVDHRSEEHTSELQSLMRISYAVFCLKKNTKITNQHRNKHTTTIKRNKTYAATT